MFNLLYFVILRVHLAKNCFDENIGLWMKKRKIRKQHKPLVTAGPERKACGWAVHRYNNFKFCQKVHAHFNTLRRQVSSMRDGDGGGGYGQVHYSTWETS